MPLVSNPTLAFHEKNVPNLPGCPPLFLHTVIATMLPQPIRQLHYTSPVIICNPGKIEDGKRGHSEFFLPFQPIHKPNSCKSPKNPSPANSFSVLCVSPQQCASLRRRSASRNSSPLRLPFSCVHATRSDQRERVGLTKPTSMGAIRTFVPFATLRSSFAT